MGHVTSQQKTCQKLHYLNTWMSRLQITCDVDYVNILMSYVTNHEQTVRDCIISTYG